MEKKTRINFFVCFVCLHLTLLISCSSSQAPKPATEASTSVNLPPDPGEEGKKTIAGIDSDADGVRDDVQRYIALTYPEQPATQKALSQYAKAKQEYLRVTDDPVKALENVEKEFRAIDCLYFREPENASPIFRKILSEVLNTKDRILASDKVSSHLGGHVFTMAKDYSQSCDDN